MSNKQAAPKDGTIIVAQFSGYAEGRELLATWNGKHRKWVVLNLQCDYINGQGDRYFQNSYMPNESLIGWRKFSL